jgi:hypothetical protein
MAQTIKLKRSAVSGNTPSTSDLELGEIAINTYDGKVFIKKNDGSASVVEVGAADNTKLPLTGGTLTGALNFGDNVKAQFGTGNDLQILHNGSHSFISEQGTGDLYIGASNNIALMNAAFSENKLLATTDGALKLYFNGSQKFETTSTGVAVTGNLTTSANLTVSGNLEVTGTTTQTGSIITNSNFTGLSDANSSNATDFGFYGKYVESSTTKYAGVYYDASVDNTFKFFCDTQAAPTTTVNESATGYALANVQVAGLTADGLTVDNAEDYRKINIQTSVAAITDTNIEDGSSLFTTSGTGSGFFANDGALGIAARNQVTANSDIGLFTKSTQRMLIADGGDISFYNDSAAQGLFWDSSASSLGIGVTNPSASYAITANRGFKSEAGIPNFTLVETDSSNQTWQINSTGASLSFRDISRAADRLTINTAGNATFSGSVTATNLYVTEDIGHSGDSDTYISFDNNTHTYYAGGTRLLDFASGSVIFNEGGGDVDFRVEGVGSSHALFVQGSDSNIGIGTTAPANKLQIGSVGSTNYGGNDLAIGDGTRVFATYLNATRDSIEFYTNRKYAFLTSGSGATGYVGIGTASPSYKLDVSGSGTVIYAGGTASNNEIVVERITTSPSKLQLQAYSSNPSIRFTANGNGRLRFLDSSDNERVSFLESGNVGIGTTAPTSLLHLSSGSYPKATFSDTTGVARNFSVGTNNETFTIRNETASADAFTIDNANNAHFHSLLDLPSKIRHTGDSDTYIEFNANDSWRVVTGDEERIKANNGEVVINDNSADMDFRVESNNNTSMLFVDGTNDKVGIGTSAPASLLNLSHATAPELRFSRTGTGQQWVQSIDSSGRLLFLEAASTGGTLYTRMVIDDTGEVGIGTGAPSSMLHVAGGSATIPTLSSSYPLTISNNGNSGLNIISSGTTNAGQINFGDTDDADAGRIRYDHSDNSMRFSTNATEYMRITSAGNVGIGTTAPNQWASYTDSGATVFQVRDTSQRARVVINGGNGAHLDLVDYAGGANDKHMNMAVDGGVLKFGSLNDAGNAFVQNNILVMDLGSGAIKFNDAFTFPTADGSANQLLKTDGSGNMSWVTVSGAGTPSYISDGDGDTKIQVEESSDEDIIRFDAGGNEVARMQHRNNECFFDLVRRGVPAATANLSFSGLGLNTNVTSGYHSLVVQNNGSEQFRVHSNGNVGIGTTAPSFPLTVYGGNQNNGSANRMASFFDTTSATTGTGAGIALGGYTNGTGSAINDFGVIQGIKENGTAGNYASALTFHTRANGAGTLEQMRISSTGNVGIGTNAPGAPLVVNASSSSSGIRVQRNGANGQYIGIHQDSNHEHVIDAVSISGAEKGFRIFNTTSGPNSYIRFGTSNAEKMRLDSSGRLLINATSTTFGDKLYVNGDTYVTGGWRTGTAATFVGELTNSSGILTLQSDANRDIQFGDSGTPAIMYIDTSTENVGIGTTAPGQKLQVQGNISAKATGADAGIGLVKSDSNNTLVHLLETGTGDGAVTVRNTSNSQTVLLRGQGNNYITGGNLGIGTASPIAKLTLPLEEANEFKIAFKAASGTGHAGISTVDQSGAGLFIGANAYVNSGGSIIYGRSDHPSSGIYFDGWSGDAMRFYTGASGSPAERMRIKADGKVGIGTTAPDQKLDVSGNIKLSGSIVDSNNEQLQFQTNDLVQFGKHIRAEYGLWARGATARAMGIDGSNGYMGLYTNTTEKVRIDTNGNVGIGTTAPANKLEVKASANDNGIMLKSTTNADLIWLHQQSTSEGVLRIYGSGGAKVIIPGHNSPTYFNNGNNFGIGTSSPDAKLQVEYNGGHTSGNVALANSSLDLYNPLAANTDEKGSILTFSDNYFDGSSYPRTTRAAIKGGTDTVGNTADGFLAFYTDAGAANSMPERMRINHDGNVGIGTSAPGSKLDVASGVSRNAGGTARFGKLADRGLFLHSDASTSSHYNWMITTQDTVNKGFEIIPSDSAGGIQFTTPAFVIIADTGNVGIGTNAPTQKLEIVESSNYKGIHIRGSVAPSLSFGRSATTTQEWKVGISGVNGNNFAISTGTGSGEKLVVDTSGNVGIGTATPTNSSGYKTLDIVGSTGGQLLLGRSSQFDFFAFSSSSSTSIGTAVGQSLIFRTNSNGGNNERMRITSAGILLVGTTSTTPGFSTTNGHAFHVGDASHMSRDGGVALVINRGTSDGGILQFRKSGTYIGGIESRAGVVTTLLLNPASGNGAGISGGTKCIVPADEAGIIDNDISLGISTHRFKDLHLSGSASIGHAVIDDYAVNTSATSAAQVDTFAAATFRSAKYTIQVTNTTDSTYHVTELLLIHDGTTPAITEYGTIFTGAAAEATFDADIVSGNVRLLATPASSDTMQFKVVRHSILV